MLSLLCLVPAFPIVGFLILALFGSRLERRAIAWIGVGSIGFSTLISFFMAWRFVTAAPAIRFFQEHLWTWMSVGDFHPQVSLYLDALSLIMVLVVTFVSFLIHCYSVEFMIEDEGYSRFFAYMNLFVASMVILVLADNLLLLYAGWEGVGLCSYLLIGFWYTDPANGLAARKAFIVTRIGDTAMILGLFLIFDKLGTLQIQEAMERAISQWHTGSIYAIAASALLLGGAVGKSAQLPLQTWLPDAMAGPTPTSALIHAATMVTAGVYLIARTHVLFTLAPPVQLAVAVIGATTLLLAGFSALTQSDIKRVLAYSTISQIGYMFLALGVGAWSAAIFHFMTHAFFKALLFLAAGVVIEALHHEHDIFKMGGLRREMPLAFWGFLIGGCSLAGLPLITAGFYSKGLIVWGAWSSQAGSPWFWAAAVLGVFLTSLYIFRLIFLVFYGGVNRQPNRRISYKITAPVAVLCVLSLLGGFVELPSWLGNFPAFSTFLNRSLPLTMEVRRGALTELQSEGVLFLAFLVGVGLAYVFFLWRRDLAEALRATMIGRKLHEFWLADWGMDWLYDRLFVRPVVWFARVDKSDFVDLFYSGLAASTKLGWRVLRLSENGQVRWYATGLAIGTVILLAVVLFR
jgi:NADH-quinone oxidoreductase subunit L